jgi:hypothetical protein
MSRTPFPRALLALVTGCTLALLLGAAAPARATIDAKSRAVLDRYVAAIGGPAAAAVRSQHSVGHLEAFAMTGRIESWSVRPDRSASALQIGPLSVATGSIGTTVWRTDPGGGKVVRLDGKELEDERGGVWFDTEAYLEPDQGGGDVSWVGEEQDSSRRVAVLSFRPPVGRERIGAFDLATGLLVRSSSKSDQRTIVIRFGDYRSEGARLVPHALVTEVVGQPMNTMRVTMDSVWVDVPVPDERFAPPEARSAVRWLRTPGVARLPFDYRVRHVWLRAAVNGGPPADFVFDTGAGITVLDSAYAARIGVKPEGAIQGEGAGATGRASFATIGKLTVAGPDGDGIEMDDLHVAVLSVSGSLAPFFWRECAGIIGFDVISRFVDEIDYDGRVLTLHDPAKFEHAGGGTAVPMTLAGGMPVVPMTVDGIEGRFRVDVGSSSTVDLHAPFVKRNGLEQRVARRVAVTGGGFGGTFVNHMVRLERLAIGPYGWDEPLLSFSSATEGAFASEDYAGNIGNRLLERFKVTLDYERRQMWLAPGARYGLRDVMTRSGMQLAREGDVVRVAGVLDGAEPVVAAAGAKAVPSPAAKAGLRAGDVVTKLDGRPLAGLGPDDVAAILEEGREGSVHTLTIVRAGKTRNVKIVLREMM